MKILALEASTDACSVAVYINGEIVERLALTPRKHIEVLKPMIEEVMAEAELDFNELDGLAFGAGPGSFAGLRIACGFIQGLGSGLNLPIVPVSTMSALALPVLEEQPDKIVLPITDARMNEVYWALITKNENGRLLSIEADQVSSIDQLLKKITDADYDLSDRLIGVGNGWNLSEELKSELAPIKVIDREHPRAGEVALLALDDLERGMGLYADQVSPIYLRDNVALTLVEQQALREEKAREKAIIENDAPTITARGQEPFCS